MTEAEKLINKHLDKLDANNIIGKDGNIYKGFLNAVNEALNIGVVSGSFHPDEVDKLLQVQKDNCVVAVMKYITDDNILEKISKAPMYDFRDPNYR